MKRFFLCLISIFLFFSLVPEKLFAEDTTYSDIEFPQWVHDLRRTEIITFGSLPFVTLWTTLGYSLAVYGEFRNPLSKNTDDFTEDDQWKIIKISAATCIGLGLTDLTINLITRARRQKRLRKELESRPFTVTPQSQMLRPRLEEETDEQALERLKREKEIDEENSRKFFVGEVESALF